MKKLIVGFVAAVSILFVQSSSFAQSPPIFGSAKFERTIGKPNTYQDTFQACNTSATYKLIVENGEGGKDRLSSASVSLNGQQVVKENEFNQRIDKIEKTVTLQPENTIDIKLASGPGGFIKASIYCISGCLDVKITSPSNESIINRSKAIVQGSLLNSTGEIGVTLQSSGAGGQWPVIAENQGNNFAGISPLQQGQNTITATATDACGYQAHGTIMINTDSIQEQIRLMANPQSGIPNANGTFSTTLEADASLPNPVSTYAWDTNGDGTAEQAGKDLSKITASYQAPGLYFPKVTITDSQNNVYTETTIVNVRSKDVMDAIFKRKWEGMKGALVSGNKDKALQYFSEGSKGKYGEIFNVLKDLLPTSVVEMGEIQFLYLKDKTAKYRVRRNQVIDGRQELVTYYIYFSVDENGLWKIVSF